MLKVETIEISDFEGNSYHIGKNQIEIFPLIGGHDADIISTRAFNQHGETFVNSFMESEESEISFIMLTENLNELEIEQQRKNLIDICNPIKGILRMTFHMNSGNSYYRDVVCTGAPFFPTGFENRNDTWQRVQLFFRALNPFYYTLPEVVEDFKGATNRFEFPFEIIEEIGLEFGLQKKQNTVINYGQVFAPVRILVKGSCVNPSITNVTTGEYIRFKNLTMSSLDTLYINTNFGEKKVTLNDENIFHKLDFSSTFFSLELGENVVAFTDEGQDSKAEIYFFYKNLFVQI
jgi:hypothetical protein